MIGNKGLSVKVDSEGSTTVIGTEGTGGEAPVKRKDIIELSKGLGNISVDLKKQIRHLELINDEENIEED